MVYNSVAMAKNINKHHDLIKYLKDCYSADNKERFILNIFSKSIENTYFLPYEYLLTKQKDELALTDKSISTITKNAFVYRKEKDLLYGSTIIKGTITVDNEKTPLMAPLFIYSAEIINDNSRSLLKIDYSNPTVNFGLINILCEYDDEKTTTAYNALSLLATSENIEYSVDFYEKCISIISSSATPIDTNELVLFPILQTAPFLTLSTKQKRIPPLQAVSAGILMLVKKSRFSRGVIDELEYIATNKLLSNPLKVLLGLTKNTKRFLPIIPDRKKTSTLNTAQKDSLSNSYNYPITFIYGPPGTGKSYTISSIAIDHMIKGYSVLIATKTDTALTVIEEKIEQSLGMKHCLIRGGDKKNLQNIKTFLSSIIYKKSDNDYAVSIRNLKNLICDCDNYINKLTKQILKKIAKEKSLTFTPNSKNNNIISQLIIRLSINSIRKTPPLIVLLSELQNTQKNREALHKILIEQKRLHIMEEIISLCHNTFTTFLNAIKARTDSKQELLFSTINFQNILTAFPIWLTNIQGIHNILPNTPEMFDLAIIDEATQCDIASCLPIFFRAKKVIIVGDPNQLRHVSFLSSYRQHQLAADHNLSAHDASLFDYRNMSILDLVNLRFQDGNAVTFLNEHFRSLPEIINFSNVHIYSDGLSIMTQRPLFDNRYAVLFQPCNGKQNSKGINHKEASLILASIDAIIDRQYARDVGSSIGVISPFRDQADYINKQLISRYPIETHQKHNLLSSTAYGFQGDERDIMFLSFAVDDASLKSTYSYMSKADVLNVTVTRARLQQYVYYSFDYTTIPNTYLIRQYFDFYSKPNIVSPLLQTQNKDSFLDDVMTSLNHYGLTLISHYSFTSVVIDLVIKNNDKIIGIDLIGFDGICVDSISLDVLTLYARIGFPVYPLEFSTWSVKKTECINHILELLS